MPEINQKFNLKSATGRNNIFDMSRQVVTTNDFGVMKPIYLRYCVPGDKITRCEVREFTRAMPMPAPTFGHIESVTRAFYVPIRSIFFNFNNFISGLPRYNSNNVAHHPAVPSFSLGTLVTVFRQSQMSTVVTDGSTPDFYSSGSAYKFTLRGKRAYDLLLSLGLNINFNSSNSTEMARSFSALPLLAVCRAYLDWIVPSRFLASYPSLLSLLQFNSNSDLILDTDQLGRILIELTTFVDNDFFSNCFDNPAGLPLGSGISRTFNYTSPQSPNCDVYLTSSDTQSPRSGDVPQLQNDDYQFDYISLQTLGKLNSMVMRGLLAGSKVQQYLESTFGIKPNNDALNISTYLGKQSHDIQIGDVTSYADTVNGDNGSYLGQFAGKGVGSGNSSFDYTVREHGYFIVTNEITPRPSYYQGIATEWEQLNYLDFFQPEFDNVGVDAVPFRRLCNDYTGDSTSFRLGSSVFGWCPRYAQLKTSFDAVSGDFRLNSRNSGLDSWYFARKFTPVSTTENSPYQQISLEFLKASSSSPVNNFDHIFQFTDNTFDHFYQIFYVKCIMSRPMAQVSDFGIEDDPADGAQTVSVNANGNVD